MAGSLWQKRKLTRMNQVGKLAGEVVERALKGSISTHRPQWSKEVRFGSEKMIGKELGKSSQRKLKKKKNIMGNLKMKVKRQRPYDMGSRKP